MASFYPAVHSVEGPNFPPRAFIVQIKANQIATHLAKGLAPLYLVAGEEPLVLQETLDAIRAAARKAGFSERAVLAVERGFSWQRVVAACVSLLLFSPRRLLQDSKRRGERTRV